MFNLKHEEPPKRKSYGIILPRDTGLFNEKLRFLAEKLQNEKNGTLM
jgi:hypothetical protein